MSSDQSNIPNWLKPLKESPFLKEPFKDELKERIRQHTASRRTVDAGRKRRLWLGLATAALLMVFAWASFENVQKLGPSNRAVDSEERSVYSENGMKRFEIFPNGNFTAGVPQGIIISFNESFEAYQGKELTVKAVHVTTGLEQTIVKSEIITKPSSGYPSLNRYTVAAAGVPLSGYWRFTVELDGSFYGDAVLQAEEPSWDVSTTFVSGPFTLRGTENRMAVLEHGFIAGKSNKYMWSLWGEESELNGPFKLAAVKQGSDELVQLFELDNTGGASEYADRYFPSLFMLPKPGNWRIMAFIDGNLFGSIVVNAETPDKPVK